MTKPRNWTDDEMLQIMWLFDVEKWTGDAIAQAFGSTRAAILGIVTRINRDLDRFDKTKRLNVIKRRRK